MGLKSVILGKSPTGLLWPSGTTMTEEVSGLTVTAGGSPSSIAAPWAGVPSALSLDVGDTLTIADHTNLDLGATFTFVFGYRTTDTANNDIFKKPNAGGGGYIVARVSNTMRLLDGAGSNRQRQATSDTTTTWHIFTFVRNGASSFVERDGTADTSIGSTTAMGDNDDSFVVGPNTRTYELAFLAWWKGTALTATDSQDIYDARETADAITVTPSTASLTLTTFAPTVTASDHKTVTPGTAELALATFAPTVTASDHKVVTPDTASLALSTFAPTVTATANQTVTPDTAALTLTTFEPTVSATAHQVVTPDAAALTLTGFAPTVSTSGNQVVTPGVASLSMTAFAPSVVITDHKVVTPDTASLALSTFAPTVTASDHKTVTPTTASLVLTAFAPTVTTTGGFDYAHATATVTLSALSAASVTVSAPDAATVSISSSGSGVVTT